MWTISEKQLQKITTSLTKAANKVSEKVIKKGVDAVENAGKEKPQESPSSNTNSQQSGNISKPEKKINSSNAEQQSRSKEKQESKQVDSQKSPSKGNAKTEQTINPILPCEQIEVVSLTSYKPTELPPKEILRARWLTNDNVEITSSLTEKKVKIQIETGGFFDGEELKIEILDSKNKRVKSIQVKMHGNTATTDVFKVEEEWLNTVLFVNFKV